MPIIIQVLLCIPIYLSGILLWPLHRWLSRKRKFHGRALAVVALLQVFASAVVVAFEIFKPQVYDVGYGWALALVELNFIFTIIGVFAWIRDSSYERRMESNHAA
jgi:H+/Cl- antiporter ClcA